MRGRSKVLLAVLAAVLALSMATGAATALRSISVNPGGAITAIARALTFTASGQSIICEVVLTGEIQRAIPKTAGALVGRITAVEIQRRRPETCTKTAGLRVITNITAELTLPWHIRYQAILGTLPRITGILLIVLRTGFLLDFTDILARNFRCLYEPDLGVLGEVVAGKVSSLRILRQVLTGRELPGGRCPEAAELAGEFRLEPAQELILL